MNVQTEIRAEAPLSPEGFTASGLAFTTTVGALKGALGVLSPVVHARMAIPVLTAVRLQIARKGGRLQLTGTDLDAQIETLLDVEDACSGAVLVHLKPLAAFLREFASSAGLTATLGERGGQRRLALEVGAVRLELGASLPVDDFPAMKQSEPYGEPQTWGETFADALQWALRSVSTEETRYYLNGVCVKAQPAGLDVVATDGHRLKLTTLPGLANLGGAPKGGFIIPTPAVKLLLDMLAAYGEVSAALSEGGALMRVTAGKGMRVLVFKLIDGTYPDYPRVIPDMKEIGYAFTVEAREYRSALRQITAHINEKTRVAKHAVTPGGVMLSARGPEDGEARARLEGAERRSGEVEMGLNARYAADALTGSGWSCALVRGNGEGGPIIFTNEDGDMNRLAIVMPLRV